jgi:hypothetical protein
MVGHVGGGGGGGGRPKDSRYIFWAENKEILDIFAMFWTFLDILWTFLNIFWTFVDNFGTFFNILGR